MRVPPPDRSLLDAETAELLELATAPSGDTAETIAVLAHSPTLVGPFLSWAMALHTSDVLSPRTHEIIALRIAHLCGSIYEWEEHVGWATNAGLTADEIAAVAAGRDGWPPADAIVIDAVDELHGKHDISDATLDELRTVLDPPGVVELIMVTGQYTMLSMLATATGPTERRQI